MELFIQLFIFGMQLGIIYALIAMGYTMVYGILRLINFAHGDLVMIGAFSAYFVGQYHGGFLQAMLAAMIIPAVISVIIERLAYRPLRKRPRLSVLITAIGVSIFLENFPRMIPFIGPDYRPFPNFIAVSEYAVYGNAVVNSIQLTNLAAATVLLLVLLGTVRFTRMGRAMRAVSFDKDASALMGINVNRTIAATFFIGAALAGAGGVLYAQTYPMIDVLMGIWLGTKAFVAAVLGGIGSIPGAVLGGLLMGLVEVYATAVNSELGYGVGFVVLILVLLFRPEGLMGKPMIEKV